MSCIKNCCRDSVSSFFAEGVRRGELTIDNAYEDITQIRVFVMAADGHMTPLSQPVPFSAK